MTILQTLQVMMRERMTVRILPGYPFDLSDVRVQVFDEISVPRKMWSTVIPEPSQRDDDLLRAVLHDFRNKILNDRRPEASP